MATPTVEVITKEVEHILDHKLQVPDDHPLLGNAIFLRVLQAGFLMRNRHIESAGIDAMLTSMEKNN